jgi:predicted nucleotidyltransferase
LHSANPFGIIRALPSATNDIAQQRGLLIERELNRMMELLIRDYEPEKLILFGSAAQGQFHAWSDLDLVVIKKTSKPLLERIEEVLRLVRPKVGLDVIVYTPEEMEALVDERRSFVLDEIIYKGAVAYERRK